MTTATATPGDPPARARLSLPRADALVWLYALFALLLALHLSMALGRSINGDEFWFHSQVEIVARAEPIQTLQTIHTRAFAWWLPRLPGNAIDHIVIARLFMLACLLAAAHGVYRIAREFADHRAALLSAAAYLGAGYVLQHGTAFRVDPIVVAFLTNALAIALRTDLAPRWIVVLGVLVGIAGMVTVKFVLWAPAFAGAALWRWHGLGYDPRYILRWIAAGAVALAVFALLFVWHGMALGLPAAGASASGMLANSRGYVFGLNDVIYIQLLGVAALNSLPLAGLSLVAVATLRKPGMPVLRKLAVLGFFAVALTPIYYRNSAPYAYVFFLPPIAGITALAIPQVAQRYGHAAIAGAIALSALVMLGAERRDVQPDQRRLVDAVHAAFPEPVAYFDCCGMIASFSKANEFRSRWGKRTYLNGARPDYLARMKAQPVPLAIDNNEDFSPLWQGDASGFHPRDAAALRDTYVRFWGQIYIAGTQLPAGGAREWEVLVPGTYTLEGALIVNGTRHADRALVDLERGPARLENPGTAPARLVWGKHPPRPTEMPPETLWVSF